MVTPVQWRSVQCSRKAGRFLFRVIPTLHGYATAVERERAETPLQLRNFTPSPFEFKGVRVRACRLHLFSLPRLRRLIADEARDLMRLVEVASAPVPVPEPGLRILPGTALLALLVSRFNPREPAQRIH